MCLKINTAPYSRLKTEECGAVIFNQVAVSVVNFLVEPYGFLHAVYFFYVTCSPAMFALNLIEVAAAAIWK